MCLSAITGTKIFWLLVLGHIRERGQGIPNDGDKRGGREGYQCKRNYNLIEKLFHSGAQISEDGYYQL